MTAEKNVVDAAGIRRPLKERPRAMDGAPSSPTIHFLNEHHAKAITNRQLAQLCNMTVRRWSISSRHFPPHRTDTEDETGRIRIEPKFFEDLMLETLLFARPSAREDVSVAKAVFAMTSSVASLIASLRLHQVGAIAVSSSSFGFAGTTTRNSGAIYSSHVGPPTSGSLAAIRHRTETPFLRANSFNS